MTGAAYARAPHTHCARAAPSSRDLRGPRQTRLMRRWRRDHDRAARDQLIEHFMPLARKLARRYARSSEPSEDLAQVASLALVRAVDRFDPERGSSFAAFAIPTILGDLRRYFRDCTWSVHVPRGEQERALAIERTNERLTNLEGHRPTVQEIAEYMELSIEEVLDGLQVAQSYSTLSLDAPSGALEEDDDCTVADTIGAEDERYELIEDDAAVSQAVQILPYRERRILELRFVDDMTQSEIAKQLNISQMQVSRVLRRSIDELRERVAA
ncbi:MAG: SigB/SigF/SigG family RNA polymerase sigma factor [Actinobacteria bacterium]|nr:MAG: SigB/SigF/SigG family RNA polymerase sigma factor [Actinomycetota bacterium]